MNPETVEPDFLDRYNLNRRGHALLGSALQLRQKVEQFARVAADERVLRQLPAAGRQCCVRQVQQIGHVERALADVQVNSSIPLFDRKGPSLRPDLPFGRAPRAAAVKDAAAKAAAPAEPAHSVLDRASTVLD